MASATIGPTTGDYDDHDLAYADIDTIAGSFDLVSEADSVVLTEVDGATYTNRTTFDGVTTSATYNVTITADVADKPLIEPSSSGITWTMLDSHVHVENHDFVQPSGNTNEIVRLGDASHLAEGVWFDRCSFDAQAAGTYTVIYSRFWDLASATHPVRFRDCVLTNVGDNIWTMQLIFSAYEHYFEIINCTCLSGAGIIEYRMGTVGDEIHLTIKNSIFADFFGSNDIYTQATDNGTLYLTGSTNNLVTDTGGNLTGLVADINPITLTDNTSPGAGDHLIVEDNTTSYNEDLRLVDDADNDALDVGVGPSSDADVSTLDYFGNTRSGSTCDPGFHQVTSAGNSGTASLTEADDTVTAEGSVEIEGSANVTEADDTTAAAGSVAIDGDADVTEDDDSAAASGSLEIGGTATPTEDDDSVSASGSVAIEGSLDATEDDDTVEASGDVDDEIQGTVAVTEDDDTLGASGALDIEGSVGTTDEDDTADGAGSLAIDGSASATEDDDTLSAQGTLPVEGAANLTEDDDSASAAASLSVEGTLAVAEDSDAVTAAGTLDTGIEGEVDLTEDDDSVSAEALLAIEGGVSSSDEDDAAQASGELRIEATADIGDEDDSVSATAVVNYIPLEGVSGDFDPLLRRRTGRWLQSDHKYLATFTNSVVRSGRHVPPAKYTGSWNP